MTVCLIAAVGRRGQLGLGGALPWHNKEDLRWFRQTTEGHVLVMGRKTAVSLLAVDVERGIIGQPNAGAVYGWSGRTVHVMSRAEPVSVVVAKYDHRIIFVAGGETVYRLWMPYVERCYITRIDYDGPADVWMPPLWEARHAGDSDEG